MYGPVSHNFCAQRSVKMILNLIIISKLLVRSPKTEQTVVVLLAAENRANCCRPAGRCHHLGYSVPPALHSTILCRSTLGPSSPGLSDPTSFLRPALPMAPTATIDDDHARDKRSVLRPNPATFLRDFALYMTTKYAIIRKRCLNHAPCLTVYSRMLPFWEHSISAKITKTRRQ